MSPRGEGQEELTWVRVAPLGNWLPRACSGGPRSPLTGDSPRSPDTFSRSILTPGSPILPTMPRPAQSGHPRREPREAPSALYIGGAASLAALIIGLSLFLLINAFQWRSALEALRDEPGIEVLSVERAGFFKKRLRGLRDPLAPTVESILQKHNLSPHRAEILMSEYHSLNTPYARQRQEAEAARLEEWRDTLLQAVGNYAEKTRLRREADLVTLTQMLFRLRFPEIMENVALEWREGRWHARGELYAPQREHFLREAPAFLVEGELNTQALIDLTVTRLETLRSEMESAELFSSDLDGQLVHIERMVRLLTDLDEVCRRSELPLARLQLVLTTAPGETHRARFADLKSRLTRPGAIPPDRLLDDLHSPGEPGSPPRASLKVHLRSTSR